MSDMTRTVNLPEGGTITYRIPDVMEQIRFFTKSGFYSADVMALGYWGRLGRVIEVMGEFIVRIDDSDCKCLEDLLKFRVNTDCLIDIAKDLVGALRAATEDEKKPSDSAPST